MHRWARALPGALALLASTALTAAAAGPPFPEPVADQAVYDTAGVLDPSTESELERIIDGIEGRTGAELVVYTQHDPDISEGENLENAKALMVEWGVGRAGFDDGMVLMLGLDPDPGESRISMYGGTGFLGAYANEGALAEIIDEDFVPHAVRGDLDAATLAAVEALDARMTTANRDRLEILRVVNAVLGIIVAPTVLAGILLVAWRHWRRHGDDPELVDSPSVLMAGPPAGMTPALATVIRNGSADQHSLNTVLVELGGSGRLTFENLDRVGSVRSDEDPDPLTDPAIALTDSPVDDDRLGNPQRRAWESLRSLAGGTGRLTRNRLWKVNEHLSPVKQQLEEEAVRLGWLSTRPTPQIMRVTWIAVGVGLVGLAVVAIGFAVPMSGAVLVGGALLLGAAGTFGFARAMSQRTYQGAYVDAMLTAYRRTLKKTMDQARSMDQVVREPEIAVLAETPDKAVVWGLALGLHDEVGRVLARGLEEGMRTDGSPAAAYYPTWLGSTHGSAWSGASSGGGMGSASGSIFSASAVPDIGGMFSALGSVGSTPPSSSSGSGGGGFSGGGGGGGGGASGSF